MVTAYRKHRSLINSGKLPSKNKSIRLKEPHSNDLKTYVFFLFAVAILGFVIMRDIALPRPVTMSIALLGFIVLFFGSFKNPKFSILILVAYLPFSKVIVGQFGTEIVGLNLSNILMIIVALGWFSNALAKGERVFNKSSLNPIILFFLLWGIFSLIRAKFIYGNEYDFGNFFILFKRWAAPVFLYFFALNMVKDKATFKKVLFIMALVTFIVALMAVRDYMHYGEGGSMEDSRIGGVFEQPNMLGAFFVYNMFLFLGFFLYYWRSAKYWLLLIPFAVCFRGIMVTFSRGAYLAFAFGGFMTAFFRSKALFVVTAILLIAVIATPALMPEGIRHRMASTFGGEKLISTDLEEIKDPSAANRILVWKGAIAMIKERPLVGFGYATFPYIIGLYAPEVSKYDAHNTYLILAAEMGIPSLVIFLIILFILIKNAAWLLKHSKDRYFKAFALGVLGGIFGLLVANMFGSRLNTEEVSSYFWLYAGLTMAAVRMKKLKTID